MSKQFKAFLVDILIIVLFFTPYLVWFIVTEKTIPKHIKWNLPNKDLIDYLLIFGSFGIHFIALSIYLLFKDVLNISLGKRIYKLKLIDRKTGLEANPIKKILRNIPLFFPVTLLLEIVLKLITPKARFGDMILDIEISEMDES